MFPLNWNIPFIRKNGSRTTLGAITGDIAGIEEDVAGLAKNKVSWDDFSEVGSVNILENDATTQTTSGITFTRNADGSITCSGTATANITYNIKTQPKLEDGKQYLLKSFQPGSSENAYLSYSDIQSADFGDYDGNGVIITKFDYSSYPNSKVRLRILNGTTFETPMTFYPLITPILDYSGPYAPYAMTNRELTESVNGIKKTVTGTFTVETPLTEVSVGYPGFNHSDVLGNIKGIVTINEDVASGSWLTIGTLDKAPSTTVQLPAVIIVADNGTIGTVNNTTFSIDTQGVVKFNLRSGMTTGDQFGLWNTFPM